MKKYKPVIIFIFSTAFVLFLSHTSPAQDAEIEKIIQEVSIDSQKGAISNYTYLMKFSYQEHKKFGFGRKLTRLYEAVLPSRFSFNRLYKHAFILLKDSERQITEAEIMDRRKEVAKKLEITENEAEKPESAEKAYQDGGYWPMSFSANKQNIKVDVLQMLKNTRLSNLQRKQIDGRNVIIVDFSPNPNSVLEKPLSYLSKIEGQIWIDETDKRIIRIEGYAPGTFAGQKDKTDSERQKEAVFLYLQTKVLEGYWFPQTVSLNFAKHPEIFETVEIEFSFNGYKKASVDVKEQVDPPKEPTDAAKETETKSNDQ